MLIIQNMQQPKILVAIRKRPLSKKQISKGQNDVVTVKSEDTVIVSEYKQKVDLTKFLEQTIFNFDYAFDEQTNNNHIYEQAIRPLVESAFQGAKVTCFAYGQTGSGKTFTMNGTPGVAGLYSLGAQDIFSYLQSSQFGHLRAKLSFYEIYCGKLFDLLNKRQQLKLREDNKNNINIIGLEEADVKCVEEFNDYLNYGSTQRVTSQNSANADSSRSHAILQISLKEGKKLFGKISFIDLAGNERGADHMDMDKQTRIDGAEINKSLLSLKECIRALDQGKGHTPFRGSKLTMVLKDSFVGFCRTIMIGNVSPSSASSENTLNTLRYADRVKQLRKPTQGSSTKEQMKAKEMMLPRGTKNAIRIMINNDDDADDIAKKREDAQKEYGLQQIKKVPSATGPNDRKNYLASNKPGTTPATNKTSEGKSSSLAKNNLAASKQATTIATKPIPQPVQSNGLKKQISTQNSSSTNLDYRSEVIQRNSGGLIKREEPMDVQQKQHYNSYQNRGQNQPLQHTQSLNPQMQPPLISMKPSSVNLYNNGSNFSNAYQGPVQGNNSHLNNQINPHQPNNSYLANAHLNLQGPNNSYLSGNAAGNQNVTSNHMQNNSGVHGNQGGMQGGIQLQQSGMQLQGNMQGNMQGNTQGNMQVSMQGNTQGSMQQSTYQNNYVNAPMNIQRSGYQPAYNQQGYHNVASNQPPPPPQGVHQGQNYPQRFPQSQPQYDQPDAYSFQFQTTRGPPAQPVVRQPPPMPQKWEDMIATITTSTNLQFSERIMTEMNFRLYQEEGKLIQNHQETLKRQIETIKSEMSLLAEMEVERNRYTSREYVRFMQESIQEKLSSLEMLRQKLIQFTYKLDDKEEIDEKMNIKESVFDDEQLLDDLN